MINEIREVPEDMVEELVTDICRETYDRFVMGGWEPTDMHCGVRMMIEHFVEQLRRYSLV